MTGKTVLITGAYGFLGRHVARFFGEQGWSVIGLGHGSWAPEERREWHVAEWHTCDVTLETLLTYGGEPDVIVHCAGSGSVGFSVSHPFQDFERTVTTALHTLEFIRLHRRRAKLIYPSSAGVYGVAAVQPISEQSPLSPVSPYGANKKMAEDLIGMYCRQFGIEAAVVRLFSVYGEGLRKQLLWDACSKVSRGECRFYGTGNETRDLLHVRDASTLLYRAVKAASDRCPVFNGGTGLGIRLHDIVSHLFSCFGVTEEPVFTGETRTGDPTDYQADISAARRLEWEPSIAWRNGVAAYVAWFKNKNHDNPLFRENPSGALS